MSGLSDRPWPLFDRKPQCAHNSARRHSRRRPLLARRHPGRQFFCDNPVGDDLLGDPHLEPTIELGDSGADIPVGIGSRRNSLLVFPARRSWRWPCHASRTPLRSSPRRRTGLHPRARLRLGSGRWRRRRWGAGSRPMSDPRVRDHALMRARARRQLSRCCVENGSYTRWPRHRLRPGRSRSCGDRGPRPLPCLTGILSRSNHVRTYRLSEVHNCVATLDANIA